MTKIAVVIPAYNEEKKLPDVLRRLQETIATQPSDAPAVLSEIIVVDDGSKDATKTVAESAGVTVLARGYNLGVGATTRDGLRYVLENGYDAAILMDADGQHAPEEALRFVKRYGETGESLIIGARNYAEIPLRRRIPNLFSRFVLSAIVGEFLPDNQSGYRLLDRDMMHAFLETTEAGYNFAIEMIIRCKELGKPIGWVPISTIYADETSQQTAWYQIVGFTKMSLAAWRRLRGQRKRE